MREAHDPGGQPLLLAVELADFDHGADIAMGDIDAGKRDRLLQDWRAGGARDCTDLRAADMDAVTVLDRLLAIHLKPDEFFLRVRMPVDERIPADKIVLLRVERHGEADSGRERVGLVAEFVTGEDETRLDTQDVEGLKTEWFQPMRLPRVPDRVEHGTRVLGMAEDLVTELPGVAGARHDDRRPVESADAADGEAEPAELIHGELRRRRPDHLPQDVT